MNFVSRSFRFISLLHASVSSAVTNLHRFRRQLLRCGSVSSQSLDRRAWIFGIVCVSQRNRSQFGLPAPQLAAAPFECPFGHPFEFFHRQSTTDWHDRCPLHWRVPLLVSDNIRNNHSMRCAIPSGTYFAPIRCWSNRFSVAAEPDYRVWKTSVGDLWPKSQWPMSPKPFWSFVCSFAIAANKIDWTDPFTTLNQCPNIVYDSQPYILLL